jgi:hypothetical protein
LRKRRIGGIFSCAFPLAGTAPRQFFHGLLEISAGVLAHVLGDPVPEAGHAVGIIVIQTGQLRIIRRPDRAPPLVRFCTASGSLLVVAAWPGGRGR